MKRREFVIKTSIGAAAAAIPSTLVGAQEDGKRPVDMVAVKNGSPAEMFDRGIAEMGGMKRFVKKGQTVVLKPNIGWDRPPEFGANTNPELVGRIVKQCLDAGAKEVLCYDHTCGNDWENRYKISGIQAAVEANGGKMVAGNTESMYVECDIPKGASLKRAKVHKLSVNPDVFINIPVLKDHSGAKITSALKNYMGCVWDRQFWHKHDLPQCIVDYSTFQKVNLTVVDAYRVMLEYGPRGKSPASAPVVKYQIISTDPVAADVAAVHIFVSAAKEFGKGKPYGLADIKYLKLAEAAGVGTCDLSKLNIKRIEIA